MAPVTDLPICVTGASGFIASHLVAQLLARGYRVRGTVRKSAADYPFLTELPGAGERLELITAELLTEGSYAPAVAGCKHVIHTASPFIVTVKDAQRDLVDPAVLGTKNVLDSCAAAGVERVVVTSSMAAVTDEPEDGHVYSEADWNQGSTLKRNPYYYSKVLAERAAWEYVEDVAEPPFELVVINPWMVLGPSLSPAINESNKILADLLMGGFPAIVNLAWPMVDVRDVALAHILAIEEVEANGRNVCAAECLRVRDVVDKLTAAGIDGYRLPRRSFEGGFGNFLVRVSALFRPSGQRTYIKTHLGRVPAFDNSKIIAELGMSFRPIDETLLETVADLEKWGHVSKKKG